MSRISETHDSNLRHGDDGIATDWNAPITDGDNWPRLVQLAWQLHDPQGKLLSRGNRIVQPDGFTIPFNSTKIQGITTARALVEGLPLDQVMEEFLADAELATYVMGHNIGFDVNVAGAELVRLGQAPEGLTEKALIDSKDEGTEFCAIPGGRGGKFKWPTLTELHQSSLGKGSATPTTRPTTCRRRRVASSRWSA